MTRSVSKHFDVTKRRDRRRPADEAWLEIEAAHLRKDVQAKGRRNPGLSRRASWKNGYRSLQAAHTISTREINHGIPELITLLRSSPYLQKTVSPIWHLGHVERPLIVSDQWMYHSQTVQLPHSCAKAEQCSLEVIQLELLWLRS